MFASQSIDPRLSRQIAAAGETGLVCAILIVVDTHDPAAQPDDAGVGAQVIEAATLRMDEPPARVRFLSQANAVVVTARPAFIQAALADQRVVLASATTINLFPWG